MKATYKSRDGTGGFFNHPVIVPQAMQHGDGFMLLGFEDWEAVNDEKFSAAITNLSEFHITKEGIGFHEK